MTYSQSFSSTNLQTSRSKTAVAWAMQHAFVLNIATFGFLILLSLVYIVQVNNTASKGYAIRDLENQIHELTLSNQQMESVAREAQSLSNISRAVKMIGLVQENHPTYIDASGKSYAFAK